MRLQPIHQLPNKLLYNYQDLTPSSLHLPWPGSSVPLYMAETALGKRVGLDQKRVSLIENGNPNIRVDSLFRLLSALDVGMALEPKAIDGADPGQGTQENNEDAW